MIVIVYDGRWFGEWAGVLWDSFVVFEEEFTVAVAFLFKALH